MKLDLSPEQRAIVEADLAGPRLVDAGAGTGKTYTLVARAVALIEAGTLRAHELLIVTFTRAAATEIAGRLDAQGIRPRCGTFHAIAADLLTEFAYEGGFSPNIHAIDDGRARGVFARAFADLYAGKLGVDLTAFPLLERPKALERSLATIALDCKSQGIAYGSAVDRARAAAVQLASCAYGSVQELRQDGRPKATWPRPDPPRSPAQRHAESLRESANVDVVAALFAHFQRLLDAESLVTFGDILMRARHLLQTNHTIAHLLRERWKHVIVDEFQDTNPAQIALLETMFGRDLRSLLVVGDIRQAIYEFNGARPQGIVDFRARAVEKLPLTLNRRSVQPILDVAHASLQQLAALAPELQVPLRAVRGDADPACVRVALFEGETALADEAAAIAAQLRALIDSGVAPRACAVLVRTRTRAPVYAQAIRGRGIAVELYGGVGFFDAPEIRDVVAWLKLADDPHDRFAVAATLQSAAIGMSDGGLTWLARGNDLARSALLDPPPAALLSAELERLARFRATAAVVTRLIDVPLIDALGGVIAASGAEVAHAPDDPTAALQVRANLDKLVRFAADFSSDRPQARIADFVAELRERDELELDLPLAQIGGDCVALMTIHGAKGLEWDHVFVVDVGASFPLISTGDRREKVAQIDPLSGALALKHGVDGRPTLRWFLTEFRHDASGNRIGRESSLDEEYRLLYVALTRARDALYVTGRKSRVNAVSRCFKAVAAWVDAVNRDDPERHGLHRRAP